MNVWVITEDEFDEFVLYGGKVIYIVEEPSPKYATHPAVTTAGALLPPVESIQFELDGNMFEAVSLYEQYLQQIEADPYISVIIAAAIKQVPIGIMFGKDELNMQFPKMLIDFVYRSYGLVFGIKNKVQPYILEEFLPIDLAKIYMINMIDYPTFITKHPPLPIHPMAISKLVYENRPLVEVKDTAHFVEYFENVRNAIHNNGGKFLVDPLEGI